MLGNTMEMAKHSASQRVVAAAADIKLGTVLAATDLKTIEIVGELPEGAILDPKLAIGRGASQDIFKGEPLIDGILANGAGLIVEIPPGMRACAVKVDDVVGVSGFATPGMFVDVIISGTPPTPNGASAPPNGTEVKTLLQNLKVLSAGPDIEKDATGKAKSAQVVNLLVTPDQAQTLSLASSNSHVQLVLRNPLDTQTATVAVSDLATLYKDPNAKPAPPPAVRKGVKKQAPEGYTVEVLNGSKGSVEKFAAPEGKQ